MANQGSTSSHKHSCHVRRLRSAISFLMKVTLFTVRASHVPSLDCVLLKAFRAHGPPRLEVAGDHGMVVSAEHRPTGKASVRVVEGRHFSSTAAARLPLDGRQTASSACVAGVGVALSSVSRA